MWFWSTQVSTVYYKRLLIVLGISLCAFILWMGMMEYSVRILKERIGQVEHSLKTQMGFPIQYSSIEPHWRLGSIVVSLNDVVMIDNETPIPFLSAKKLQLVTTPFRLILNSEQPFNELNIDGMKMVLGWDKGKDLTVLGLKGEWFSSSFDYQALLKALSSQKQIRFSNSEILWQGPKTTILQQIDGKLSWEDVKTHSWQFVGKQQIKLNDKGEFWPLTFVTMQMNTQEKLFKIKADMERTRLLMKIYFPKEDQKSFYLDSVLEGRDIDLRALHQNVRLTESDPAWLNWLIEALERGSITRGKVHILGPVDDLNWFGDIAFNNVNLLYNPDWPRIRKASGKVWIQKDQVKVQVDSGNILGAPIKQVEALIAPIGPETSPELKIEGALSGRLETGLQFLLLSPLKKTLGEHLNPLKPSGQMDLHLNLNIPLGESKKPVEVQGQLIVEKGVVNLEALDVPMTDIKGLFRFTEKGVEAKGVSAELLDKPVQIEASPERVTASTLVDSEFLQERFDSHFLRYLTGESLMSVSYLKNGEWVVESSLQGMSIELPYPYAKKAVDILPMTFTVYPAEGKENYYAFTAKNTVNAKWTTETKGGETKLKRGQILLGGKNSEWISNNVLYIGGDVPYLNIEEWKAFLNQETDLNQEWAAETDQNKDSENKSEIKLPVQINIMVAELEAFGLDFKDTAIKHLTNTSEWTLDGPTVKGSMILPTEKHQSLQFSFQHLKLSSKQIDVNNQETHKLFKEKDRIPIIFSAQSLTFDDAWFGETNFRLFPKAYGYEIQELSLRNKASRLEGRGEWRINTEGGSSHLMGEILSDNMSQTFAQWGLSSAMQEGKGRIQFNLQWPGSPFQVSFKKVAGAADLKLRSGHILGMNPGLGKVLGLLSLENLVTRRLQLDFSDVFKKGFVFDKLEANMQFKTGFVETDNLFIDGPAAKVKISGVANLSNKEIDLQMLVTPKVGNTLPIVAGVATGNPAIGVGVWVVDKLTGSRISEVSQRRYHVTGTWDAPQMNELGKKPRNGRK